MKTLILYVIRAYQAMSRLFAATPFVWGGFSGCRSWPTCSDYAINAIEQHGLVRGGCKAVAHVVRCNPL